MRPVRRAWCGSPGRTSTRATSTRRSASASPSRGSGPGPRQRGRARVAPAGRARLSLLLSACLPVWRSIGLSVETALWTWQDAAPALHATCPATCAHPHRCGTLPQSRLLDYLPSRFPQNAPSPYSPPLRATAECVPRTWQDARELLSAHLRDTEMQRADLLFAQCAPADRSLTGVVGC